MIVCSNLSGIKLYKRKFWIDTNKLRKADTLEFFFNSVNFGKKNAFLYETGYFFLLLFFFHLIQIKLSLSTLTVELSLNYSPGNNAVSRQMYSVAPNKMFR